jgi:hypothetical protein
MPDTASQEMLAQLLAKHTMPSEGQMQGVLHLNEAIAPKVPNGSPRPFAPGEWVDNPGGSWSSEISVTVTDPQLNGGKPTVIPSLWLVNGKPQRVSEDQAATLAAHSGLNFPAFKDIAAAEKFATDREAAWQGLQPAEAVKIAPLWAVQKQQAPSAPKKPSILPTQ